MSDSDNEEKERIINQAIEMMTKRKGQPGIIRICRFVRRKYRMPYKETRRVVKKMVQDGNVVKENTEGEECYRNALKLRVSKISHKIEPTAKAGPSTEGNPKTEINLEEYKVVSQPESDVKETSKEAQVVGPDIYQNETGSMTMDQGTVPSPCLLEFALTLEECIEDSDPFEDQYPDNWNEYREAVAASLTNLGNGHGFFDVGRFDQDGVFRFIPEAFFPLEKCKDIRRPKRGSKHYGSTIVKKDPINDSSDEEKCDFCGKGASSNKKGHPEDLLKCKDCSAKAHPTCMDYGPELAIRSRLGPWQCINCKTCTVCGDSGNAESMLVCDCCDKGYHMSCHTPKIIEQPIGKWACQSCATELVIPEETNICSDNDNVTVRHSTEDKDSNGATNIVRNIEEDDEQCLTPDGFLENYPMVVPDATNWSVKDVERFVAKVGFPEQATVFREQEIDGKSLLLLKRSDVLTNLSLRLGPALKIYKHVERLQLFLGSGLQH